MKLPWLKSFLFLLFCSFIPLKGGELSEREAELITHVEASLAQANQEISKLDPAILKIPGMSSAKVRHFLNNLCSLSDTHYLEIGNWKGSTWISALYKNEMQVVSAIAIDNWSSFEGPYEIFQANCEKFLPYDNYTTYSEDSFQIDLESVFHHPITVYFYDGDHSMEAQEKAFTYFDPIFDDVFIAVIDDWRRKDVKIGTHRALHKLGYTILLEKELYSGRYNDSDNWWNGLLVVVLRKSCQ